jgi:hypothetical protein
MYAGPDLQVCGPRGNQNVEDPIGNKEFMTIIFALFVFLTITTNTDYFSAILEKQMSHWNLRILFLFCGGPRTTPPIAPPEIQHGIYVFSFCKYCTGEAEIKPNIVYFILAH